MSYTQDKFYKKIYGRIGEKKAEKYLKKLGYKFIARNYETDFGEVDLIFKEGQTYVFVEVKTRSGDYFGEPSQAVDYRKQQKYIKMALNYMQKLGQEAEIRFDIVEVKNEEINHIKGAFFG